MTDILTTYAKNPLPYMMQAPSPAKNSALAKDRALAQETAQDFEAFFMTRMMESMFDGISTEGMFGGGQAEKIYRSLLLNEYGKVMAKTGSVGISDDIMNTIIQMQEAQSSNAL